MDQPTRLRLASAAAVKPGPVTKCHCRATRSSAMTCTNNPTITNYSCRIIAASSPIKGCSPRADPARPSAWSSLQARWVGRGADPYNARRSDPGAGDLSPGDRRTPRDADGLVLLMSRDPGAVAAGPVAAGGGSARRGRLTCVRGSRRARRATARRAQAKLRPRNGETPAIYPVILAAQLTPRFAPAHDARPPGGPRRGCALETVENVVAVSD